MTWYEEIKQNPNIAFIQTFFHEVKLNDMITFTFLTQKFNYLSCSMISAIFVAFVSKNLDREML